MTDASFPVEPVGFVRSVLIERHVAPRQGYLGAPEAWIEIVERAVPGLLGVVAGDEVVVLTWLHLAKRDVLRVHPRGDMGEVGIIAAELHREGQ